MDIGKVSYDVLVEINFYRRTGEVRKRLTNL